MTQSQPPPLSSTNTEVEAAGPDPEHACTGADENPQHLHHAETAETELERPSRVDERRAATQTALPRRYRRAFLSTRRPNPSLQRHSEDSPESSAYQLDQLGDLSQDRPTWKETLKTGAAIYEVSRITAAKVKL
nr:unnamed protein product [Spirometra erinaceieuropaei]